MYLSVDDRSNIEQQWKEAVAFYSEVDDPSLRRQGLDDEYEALLGYIFETDEHKVLLKIAHVAAPTRGNEADILNKVLQELRSEITCLADPELPLVTGVRWICFRTALFHGYNPGSPDSEKEDLLA